MPNVRKVFMMYLRKKKTEEQQVKVKEGIGYRSGCCSEMTHPNLPASSLAKNQLWTRRKKKMPENLFKLKLKTFLACLVVT